MRLWGSVNTGGERREETDDTDNDETKSATATEVMS